MSHEGGKNIKEFAKTGAEELSSEVLSSNNLSRAPILSYDVPEPVSYNGRNFIELKLGKEYFKSNGSPSPSAVTSGLGQDRPSTATSSSDAARADLSLPNVSQGEAQNMAPNLRGEPDGPPPERTILSIKITSPSQNAEIIGLKSGVEIQVRGTADYRVDGDDFTSEIASIHVKFGNNDFKPAAPVVAEEWSRWSFSDIITSEGEIKILAKVTTKNGKSKDSAPVNVTVRFGETSPPPDTIPPQVSITSPASNNEKISGPSTGIPITVLGTATDAGGSGIRQVEVKFGNNDFKPAAPRVVGDWSTWALSDIIKSEGDLEIVARALDGNNNYSRDDSQDARRVIKTYFDDDQKGRLGRPRLFLIESYRLTSHLGEYGAGRTLKTFTLLPGEKTKISIKTYTKKESDKRAASSILDSVTDESQKDFEIALQSEQTDKKEQETSNDYEARAKGSATWGWGSIEASVDVKGSSNSTREEFAKNVSNATQKHVSKASAKREVQVNTNYEVKEQSGEETAIEREIENINVSRTLNFIFSQMNQKYYCFLHMIDVRIGFLFDIDPHDRTTWIQKEVPLHELDKLLEEVIEQSKREEVKQIMINQLTYIFDYKGEAKTEFVKETSLRDKNGNLVRSYWRVDKDYKSTYTDPITKTVREISGIILAVNDYVLRTEGIVVEAILGQGDALDEYSHGLQSNAVRTQVLKNMQTELELEKTRLVMKLIQEHPADAVNLLKQLNQCCPQYITLPLQNTPKEKENSDVR
jgi:hypothetical protein